MAKKGARNIPDFSSKKSSTAPGARHPQPGTSNTTSKPPATPQTIKPQATSSKSGRRGG
jgi:hypothetical protein